MRSEMNNKFFGGFEREVDPFGSQNAAGETFPKNYSSGTNLPIQTLSALISYYWGFYKKQSGGHKIEAHKRIPPGDAHKVLYKAHQKKHHYNAVIAWNLCTAS